MKRVFVSFCVAFTIAMLAWIVIRNVILVRYFSSDNYLMCREIKEKIEWHRQLANPLR